MSTAEASMPFASDSFAGLYDSGVIMLTPALAQYLIDKMPFDGQRPIRERRVAQLVIEMRAGRFKKSVIDIGAYGDQPFLLNGQHRVHAVIVSGVAIPVVVVLRRVRDRKELAAEYAVLDNPLVRSHADNLHAYGFAERLDVSPSTISRATACAPIIAAGFSVFPSAGVHMSITPNRATFIEEWGRAISDAYEVLGSPDGLSTRRFWQAHMLSCALVTLRYQKEVASVFWSRVVANDGLRKGTPEHTLVNSVMARRPHGSGENRTTRNRYTRSVAVCWNAAYEGRGLTLVKIADPNAPIKFLGTPYDGTRHIRPYTPVDDD